MHHRLAFERQYLDVCCSDMKSQYMDPQDIIKDPYAHWYDSVYSGFVFKSRDNSEIIKHGHRPFNYKVEKDGSESAVKRIQHGKKWNK